MFHSEQGDSTSSPVLRDCVDDFLNQEVDIRHHFSVLALINMRLRVLARDFRLGNHQLLNILLSPRPHIPFYQNHSVPDET